VDEIDPGRTSRTRQLPGETVDEGVDPGADGQARHGLHGSLLDKRVAVLGADFKPDSDDIRDSPVLNVAAQLQQQGAVVRVTDPAAVENSGRLWPQLDYADTAEEAAERADAVLVVAEWWSTGNWTRWPSAPWSRRSGCSTGATPSTARPGRRPAGPTEPSAAGRAERLSNMVGRWGVAEATNGARSPPSFR
jgi:hypothetical protein